MITSLSKIKKFPFLFKVFKVNEKYGEASFTK